MMVSLLLTTIELPHPHIFTYFSKGGGFGGRQSIIGESTELCRRHFLLMFKPGLFLTKEGSSDEGEVSTEPTSTDSRPSKPPTLLAP